MQKQYLIAKSKLNADAVFDLATASYWVWQDEREKTEKEPYQLIFLNGSLDTRIHYLEDVFGSQYFYTEGVKTEQVAAQLREMGVVYDRNEVLSHAIHPQSEQELAKTIFELGLLAPPEKDATLLEIFQDAFAHPSYFVRQAAVWTGGYVDWPEIKALVEKATKDSDPRVREDAELMLEAYDHT